MEDLAIKVPVGKVYGFLGRNGSGKTTTIRLIMGLIRPDKGQVKIFGNEMNRTAANTLQILELLLKPPAFTKTSLHTKI